MRTFTSFIGAIVTGMLMLLLGGCGSGEVSPVPITPSLSSTASITPPRTIIGHYVGLIPQEGVLEGITRDVSDVPACSTEYDSVNLILGIDVSYNQMTFHAFMKEDEENGPFVIDYRGGTADSVKAVIVNGIALQTVPGEGDPSSSFGAMILQRSVLQGERVSSVVLCVASG